MDTIKPNQFLEEVEIMLSGLGLDTQQARQTFPTCAQYFFNYNDVKVYLGLPSIFPSAYSNVARLEATIAELNEVDAGHLIVALTGFLYNDCTPVKITSKPAKNQRVEVLLSFVVNLELLREGALATILLHLFEVADQMRNDFIGQKEAA